MKTKTNTFKVPGQMPKQKPNHALVVVFWCVLVGVIFAIGLGVRSLNEESGLEARQREQATREREAGDRAAVERDQVIADYNAKKQREREALYRVGR